MEHNIIHVACILCASSFCRYDFQFTEDDENNQYLLEVVIPRYWQI